ncbi:NADH dehydrogenase ubiquinone 1 beta subcomplex subunit 7, partial [Vespula squamosa]
MVVFSSVSLKSSFSQTKMGTLWSSSVIHPDIMPEAETPPTFDSLYGFQNGRKARVMTTTDAEMKAARIPKRFRDYCAHKFLELEDCKKYHFPMMSKCNHQSHAYQQCQYDEPADKNRRKEQRRSSSEAARGSRPASGIRSRRSRPARYARTLGRIGSENEEEISPIRTLGNKAILGELT